MDHAEEPGPHYCSSPGDLSDPPSGEISEPGSPSRVNLGGTNTQMDDIAIGETPPPVFVEDGKRYAIIDGKQVQLTAAGVPRKKPGRKPGSAVKPKATEDAEAVPKARKPRKPRESDGTPIQRKRKIAPATNADVGADSKSLSTLQYDQDSPILTMQVDELIRSSQKAPKRDSIPSSMQSILNAEPDEEPLSTVRSTGQKYDPIRGNYDPVRETMSYRGGASADSTPYAAALIHPNRAHASPSIASLIDPPTASPPRAPHANHSSVAQAHPSPTPDIALPESLTHSLRPAAPLNLRPASVPLGEIKKLAPTLATAITNRTEPKTKESSDAPSGKKVMAKQKASTAAAPTPPNDDQPQANIPERSILDFGKANPGEEVQAPTIVLDIPIKEGETNKYINFMRLAEERYGWDALHPRQAANRDRKARIAAAFAALDKAGSGRESGDEMSVDLSDVEGSNVELGASGVDVPAKPARKKRNFKEDEYDIEDDFVDDSEMQWENQAAASRDGFFVYMGPLLRETDKIPAVGADGTGKRGRRGGGAGSRGGRGASRGANGAGRGAGAGSRGGVTRKPRATKSEKAQREKAERESLGLVLPTNSILPSMTS